MLNDIRTAELSAKSNVESRTQDTSAAIKGIDAANGGSLRSSSIGGGFMGFGATAQDFIGINALALETMNGAIDTYCKAVTDELNNFEDKAKTQGRFAGQYADAIKAFMTSMKSSCIAQVEALTEFKKDLASVIATMKAKDEAVAENINSDANSIAGASSVESN